MAFRSMLGLVLLAGAASPGLLPQQPYADSLPSPAEEVTSQVWVVQPPSESAEQHVDSTSVIEGRIIFVDATARRMGLVTSTGVREIAIPPFASISVSGGRIQTLRELPRDGHYLVRVSGTGDGPTIDLVPVPPSSGPAATPPVPNSEQIGP